MSESSQITITVKFFATLREYGPAKEIIKLPKKSTIKVLFEKYKIPKEERQVVILVNTKPHQTEDTILKDGDVVAIFPPIGGGTFR